MNPLGFSPFDPEIRDDPYPTYARLRREAPVFRAEGLGGFVVSRYDDVLAVLKNPEGFSSAPFADLMSRVNTVMADRAPVPAEELWEAMPETLIGSDPPVHTRLRKIVNRGFTPARIAGLERRIRAIAGELVDAFAERGACELVGDFAAPFPITVIAELLGVDPEQRAEFKRGSDALLAVFSGTHGGERAQETTAASLQLLDYLDVMIAARRAAPRDDLISELIRAESREEALGEREVKLFTTLLLVAGNETTTNLLGNLVLALLAHPEERLRASREPGRIPRLVEEALRYDAPVQLTFRRATRAGVIAGVEIPEGSLVIPLLGSANRDESRFREAHRFDVDRPDLAHLAFGFGTHFCLGAGLARLEARVATEVLLARLPELECREERIPRAASLLVRGPARLQLGFEPRGAGALRAAAGSAR